MIRVVHVDEIPQYRVSFYEGIRSQLAKHGVQYDLVTGQPNREIAAKEDVVSLGWERRVANRHYQIGKVNLVWHPVLHEIRNCDLAIVGQENGRIVNYVAQILGPIRRSKLAFFGHGKNFQADSDKAPAERWKRFWATKCDWWFTYTNKTRELIESYGFPPDRITVFHNAVDTSELRRWDNEIKEDELGTLRRQLDIDTDKVAVYVGGLYDIKRLGFLIEAAKEVRRCIPDFVLIVIGAGVDQPLVEAAAAVHPWIRYLGPRFGREKAALMRLSKAFLMPGAVGLAILDCSALGTPIVTTGYPFHGPEISYLESGENGLMVEDWRNVAAYANAVVSLLCNDVLQAKLATGARAMAQSYTIENMVDCFCAGVLSCLATKKR